MICILPAVRELQDAGLTDLVGTGGVFPAPVNESTPLRFRKVSGTFSDLANNHTQILTINFSASINIESSSIPNYTITPTIQNLLQKNISISPETINNIGAPGTAGQPGCGIRVCPGEGQGRSN